MDFNKDYYGVLGVSPSAEDFLIKAAYKALAQRYHPDKLEDYSQASEDKMKALNEAYSILSDAHKRKQYDDYLKSKNVNKTTQSEYQEEQNRNETNQENGQLILFFSVAAIVSLIVNAILFIASIFVVFFSFVISIAGNFHQNFTAHSDEKRKRKQHDENLRKQRDEELKRKKQAEDLKRNQQHNESVKYKQQDGENSGWVVVMVFIAIAVIAFVNYKPVTPPTVSSKPERSVQKKVATGNAQKCISPNQGDCVDRFGTYIESMQSPPVSTEPVPSIRQETITFTNGAKYIGEVKNGKPEGQGAITYADGGKYVGEWAEGKREGQGTYTYAQGDTVTGEWKNGQPVQNNPQATTQAESTPVKTHKKTSNKSKRDNKARERAEAQAQEQEEVQIREQIETLEQADAQAQAQAQAQADANYKSLLLSQQQAQQQAADERQRTEIPVLTEDHAERYEKYMQSKERRDRDTAFQRLKNY